MGGALRSDSDHRSRGQAAGAQNREWLGTATATLRHGSRIRGINKQSQKVRQQLTPAASFVGQSTLRKKSRRRSSVPQLLQAVGGGG